MRILIIQENGRHAANRAFRECFSLRRAFISAGWAADVWGLGHQNFAEAPDWNKYDVIFNLENYDERGWLPCLADAKAYKVLWAIDEHCRDRSYYARLFSNSKMNLWLHSTRDYVTDHSRDLWFPNCYDKFLIGWQPVPKRADVGFCGSVLNRAAKLAILRASFNFVSDIWVLGDEMVRAINSYRIAWNCNLANDLNYRNFEVIGCGVPLATNFNEQFASLGFEDGKNCLLYHSDSEMVSKIKGLLADKGHYERLCLATKALAAKHTYTQRVLWLIGELATRL